MWCEMMQNQVFRPLQLEQKKHDEKFHADIYYLSYPARMTHFVLHFSKYVGRLAEIKKGDSKAKERLTQTLADTFIVALSASDVLNIDFDDKMTELFGKPESHDIAGWAEMIDNGAKLTQETLPEWWMDRMAVPTGKMAKALESLDHMEPVNVRVLLTDGLLEILVALIIAAKYLKVDLKTATLERWAEIAKRREL